MINPNITRQHVLDAIEVLRETGWPARNNSDDFDVLWRKRRYPPKQLVRKAAEMAGVEQGRFYGGEETNSFLRRRGFKIVGKSGDEANTAAPARGSGKILGHSATRVFNWMGANGFTNDQARRVYDSELMEGHIKWEGSATQALADGRNGKYRKPLELSEDEEKKIRAIAKGNSADTELNDTENPDAEFQKKVAASLKDPEARAARLAKAPKRPRRIMREVLVYERNPDVVAEVLTRAKGRCEKCRKHAPFPRRIDGSPYLEVHHQVQLAHGGEDTVQNAIALCPNCHRREHHG